MVRNPIDLYLQIAVNLESEGDDIAANYALKRAIEIESQSKQIL